MTLFVCFFFKRTSQENHDSKQEILRAPNKILPRGKEKVVCAPESPTNPSINFNLPSGRSSTDCGFIGSQIEGMSRNELAVFYQHISSVLASRLTRIQAEALRIGHLKAFNDAQTVKVSADKYEIERLTKFCKKRYELLATERILCAVKCRYQGEQMSEGRWNRMRLIILRNSIIFDPEFYGSRVSTQSVVVHCQQVCEANPRSKYTMTMIIRIITCNRHYFYDS
jgi:hypothetical protein